MTYRLRIWYEATDLGSRRKPFQIIEDRKYSLGTSMIRHKKTDLYIITVFTRDDPEEVLQALQYNGEVFVLKMEVDNHEFFLHPRWPEFQKRPSQEKEKAGKKK